MSASLTGATQAIALTAGSGTVTVDAGCTALYVSWSYYNATAAKGLTSITLAGAAPSANHVLQTAATDLVACGVAVWYNPPLGAQTLAMTFDAAQTEGPTVIASCVQNGDTTAWRDVKSAHGNSSGQISVTVTTVSGDLVLKHDQRNDAAANAPTTSVGWTGGGGNSHVNSEHAQVEYIIASGVTQVCDSEDENYSSVVAWSIPAGAGAGLPANQVPSVTSQRNRRTVGRRAA